MRIVAAGLLALVALGCGATDDRSAGAAPVATAAVAEVKCDSGGSEGAGVGPRDIVVGSSERHRARVPLGRRCS